MPFYRPPPVPPSHSSDTISSGIAVPSRPPPRPGSLPTTVAPPVEAGFNLYAPLPPPPPVVRRPSIPATPIAFPAIPSNSLDVAPLSAPPPCVNRGTKPPVSSHASAPPSQPTLLPPRPTSSSTSTIHRGAPPPPYGMHGGDPRSMSSQSMEQISRTTRGDSTGEQQMGAIAEATTALPFNSPGQFYQLETIPGDPRTSTSTYDEIRKRQEAKLRPPRFEIPRWSKDIKEKKPFPKSILSVVKNKPRVQFYVRGCLCFAVVGDNIQDALSVRRELSTALQAGGEDGTTEAIAAALPPSASSFFKIQQEKKKHSGLSATNQLFDDDDDDDDDPVRSNEQHPAGHQEQSRDPLNHMFSLQLITTNPEERQQADTHVACLRFIFPESVDERQNTFSRLFGDYFLSKKSKEKIAKKFGPQAVPPSPEKELLQPQELFYIDTSPDSIKHQQSEFIWEDSLWHMSDEEKLQINCFEVPLLDQLPIVRVRPLIYALRAGAHFFLIHLPPQLNVDHPAAGEFERLLLEFGKLQRMPPDVVTDTVLDKTANSISAGGEMLGKGIVKGASFIGLGMKKGTNMYTNSVAGKKVPSTMDDEDENEETRGNDHLSHGHQQHPPPLPPQQLNEEEIAERQKQLDQMDKGATILLTGARGVKQGLSKGLGMVGKAGAAVAVTGGKKVQKTDWYQEKERKDKLKEYQRLRDNPDAGPETKDTLKKVGGGTVGVAKSSINAGSSVISGVKQAFRSVSADIRDNTVALAEHNNGEASGQQTKQTMEIAAKFGLTGLFAFQLYTTEAYECALFVGAGAISYDPDRKDLLKGMPWKLGWMTKQGSLMNPWSPRYAILRTYSIAFYKQPPSSPNSQSATSYIPLTQLRDVQLREESETRERWSFSIHTDSDIYYFSLNCSGRNIPNWQEKPDQEMLLERSSWMNHILALTYFSRISKMIKD